jgi:hypothetical protein
MRALEPVQVDSCVSAGTEGQGLSAATTGWRTNRVGKHQAVTAATMPVAFALEEDPV